MNLLSINIRGIKGDGKGNWIKKLKTQDGISFIAMQEIQCGGVSEDVIRGFWGPTEMEFESVEPHGRSGGLISIWDPSIFKKMDCFKSNNYLMIKGRLKGCDEFVFVVNVYAPQNNKEKRELWDSLANFKSAFNGFWFLIGDFNTVRSTDERLGSTFKPRCAKDFNNFIASSDLHEFYMRGGKFTFLRSDDRGNKLSKIDRILVGREVVDKWPNACLRALPRLLSDHNPLMLKMIDVNFGPKPFRLLHSWMERHDFDKVVSDAFDSFIGNDGAPDTRFLLKLRWVRDRLKDWRKEIVNAEGEESEMCKKELQEIEQRMEETELSEEENWTRMECKKKDNGLGSVSGFRYETEIEM